MTRRLLDVDGSAWPVTGQRCPVCRMPADPVLNGDPHMFCAGPVPPLSPQQCAARIRAIAEMLGGEVITARPLDRWRVSGLPVVTPDPVLFAVATAADENAMVAVWRQHATRWTDAHTRAARARLATIGAAA